jgi:putative transposase
MYSVRKLKIGRSAQLDKLARAAGRLYSATAIAYWRTVNKQGIWLKASSMMRWKNSDELHAHTADAVVQSFYASLRSWHSRRILDSSARPPKRLRKYYKLQWKKSAIKITNGMLVLSNGKGNERLTIQWQWQLPVLVEIGFDGKQYELRATYAYDVITKPLGNKIAAADLGEVHPVVTHDGNTTIIVNGRLSRSKKQYRNKMLAKLSALMSTKQKGSRRHKRLKRSKYKQLKKVNNQIIDITHKQTSALISTLHNKGVQMLVIGDIRTIRHNTNLGNKANQKIHQMHHGKIRHMLEYKAARLGMSVTLIDEAYTTQTCPRCSTRYKPRGREYKCSSCSFVYHRDGVGAINILKKYRGKDHVVGVMASPLALRYSPHMLCSS